MGGALAGAAAASATPAAARICQEPTASLPLRAGKIATEERLSMCPVVARSTAQSTDA